VHAVSGRDPVLVAPLVRATRQRDHREHPRASVVVDPTSMTLSIVSLPWLRRRRHHNLGTEPPRSRSVGDVQVTVSDVASAGGR
jgi:hypothetical protein